MKALLGVVSLLLALAIIGSVAVKQLRAVGAAAPANAAQASGSGPAAPQARQLPSQVADDVAKAMNQGAAARREEADKP